MFQFRHSIICKIRVHEMLKNSVKMGVSKIVKNVKFYLLKFYSA